MTVEYAYVLTERYSESFGENAHTSIVAVFYSKEDAFKAANERLDITIEEFDEELSPLYGDLTLMMRHHEYDGTTTLDLSKVPFIHSEEQLVK